MSQDEQPPPTADPGTTQETAAHTPHKYSINIESVHGNPIIGDAANVIITFLGIAASISSITQVILMVADLRSRKQTKKKHTESEVTKNKGWDEIKEIRVLMSDGSLVQIDAWLSDPERVKGFIALFNSPTASPKPSQVVFLLKNGSRLPVTLTNDGQSKQDFDALIKYLALE